MAKVRSEHLASFGANCRHAFEKISLGASHLEWVDHNLSVSASFPRALANLNTRS